MSPDVSRHRRTTGMWGGRNGLKASVDRDVNKDVSARMCQRRCIDEDASSASLLILETVEPGEGEATGHPILRLSPLIRQRSAATPRETGRPRFTDIPRVSLFSRPPGSDSNRFKSDWDPHRGSAQIPRCVSAVEQVQENAAAKKPPTDLRLTVPTV